MSESISGINKNESDTFLHPLPFYSSLRFVVYGILIPIVVVVGNLGNILTAIVLWSKEMASTTNLFLRALVLSDIAIITLTSFGRSSFYMEVYTVWMYAAVYFAIPLTMLMTLNVLILIELKRMQIRRKRMGTEPRAMSEKANITKTIVLIVAVFTFVQTLGFISQLDYWINDYDQTHLLGTVVNFLYVVNSSINFVIYIAMGKKFRQNFLALFSKCKI
ncbi:FMRFamide receptor-like [Mizuhopecten yessoensis]|uniref:FMRFamide receptor-like n=1 Tax=Mizuhopecten yessoensis TaxID=6573 RepID=UPI000B4571F7|nr:FMRFamide receptor-like [Mizuhopecten yessoensis]